MQRKYSYDDILLTPRYSYLNSRSEANTSVEFLERRFELPVIPANMDSVIDKKIAYYLSQNNYFYIYHRFGNDMYTFVKDGNNANWNLISISTGVNGDSLEILDNIRNDNFRIDYITIDVAHAWHVKVKNRIQWLKNNFPNTKIIAGNVCTGKAVHDLIEWGADAIKVGIGQGSICTTRHQTGFSYPMFSCAHECSSNSYIAKNQYGIPHVEYHKHTVPIIADGSIRHIGDISKAIVAGATMVMSGFLFASCVDSPAHIVNGKKQYYGSTSFEAKQTREHIEGKLIEIPFDVTYEERLKEIQMGLRSAISYAGGKNLTAFKDVGYYYIN